MSKIYLTSDWHVGEQNQPNTHSFLRPRLTSIMVSEWMVECHRRVQREDTLCFLGDLSIQLTDLDAYLELPSCHKVLVVGDKEYANKYFSRDDCIKRLAELGIFDEVVENKTIEIGGIQFFASHKPIDCLNQGLPALCGHIHGIWRTARMPNGQPIINVGIDAWGGLVTEGFVLHQHTAVVKGYYDANAFSSSW